jgi:hypothetical protein
VPEMCGAAAVVNCLEHVRNQVCGRISNSGESRLCPFVNTSRLSESTTSRCNFANSGSSSCSFEDEVDKLHVLIPSFQGNKTDKDAEKQF